VSVICVSLLESFSGFLKTGPFFKVVRVLVMLCIRGRSVEYVIIWLRVVLGRLSFVRPRQSEQKSNKKKMVFSRLWYVFLSPC